MAGPNQQAQSSQHENSLDFLWLVVIILAAIVLTWYFGKAYIAAFIYQVRYFELLAIKAVLSVWDDISAFIPFLPQADMSKVAFWQTTLETHKLGASLSDIGAISTYVGSFIRYPIILILTFAAAFVYSKNVTMKFKNIFNMKRLKESEANNWPQIAPVAKLNLLKEDIEKGPWAMAMTPMQFCKENHLIDEVIDNDKVVAKLRRGEAYNLFVLQLGGLWTRPEKLPIHVKALFAIFCACAHHDRGHATKLLHQISESASVTGKLNFAGAEELFNKYLDSKLTKKVLKRHAYLLPVMSSMLELARTDGVLASSEFLWLKPLDRKLWYMLNSVGRQTAVPEISGPFAHWLAERKLGRALKVPMVEEAVNGLEAALAEVLYEVEED
jgi:intracellular multiplication protein IcmP